LLGKKEIVLQKYSPCGRSFSTLSGSKWLKGEETSQAAEREEGEWRIMLPTRCKRGIREKARGTGKHISALGLPWEKKNAWAQPVRLLKEHSGKETGPYLVKRMSRGGISA